MEIIIIDLLLIIILLSTVDLAMSVHKEIEAVSIMLGRFIRFRRCSARPSHRSNSSQGSISRTSQSITELARRSQPVRNELRK